MKSVKKLWAVMLIVVISIFGFTLTAAAETITVGGEDGISYDLSVYEDDENGEFSGAMSYVDGYADNLQADENFDANINTALDTVRTEIPAYATWLALIPPIIAIALALITKEVYSSLFLGILTGGIIYAGANFEGIMVHVFQDGL